MSNIRSYSSQGKLRNVVRDKILTKEPTFIEGDFETKFTQILEESSLSSGEDDEYDENYFKFRIVEEDDVEGRETTMMFQNKYGSPMEVPDNFKPKKPTEYDYEYFSWFHKF